MNLRERQLMQEIPLMKCGNKTEFLQRLQWLSEGMLRNHLEHIVVYKVSQAEKDAYRKFKEGLSCS